MFLRNVFWFASFFAFWSQNSRLVSSGFFGFALSQSAVPWLGASSDVVPFLGFLIGVLKNVRLERITYQYS
jgi:hypothetical protein